MAIVLTIVAVLILLSSAYGVLSPTHLVAYAVEFLGHPGGIWWAAAIRLVVAIVLWFSAPVSRTPVIFRVLAVVVFFAAITIPVVGAERLLSMLHWFAAQPTWLVRVVAAMGVAFAAFLLWSVTLKWTAEKKGHE